MASLQSNFHYDDPYAQATLTSMPVICIPHAGSGVSAFSEWKRLGVGNMIVAPLPGRDARYGETLARSIPALAHAVVKFIEQRADDRIQIFGHSMGGLVAFEVASMLQQRRPGILARLVVSGCRAPDAEDPDHLSEIADDEEFLQAVAALGGVPEQLLRDYEFRKYLTPILRADLSACEAYIRPPNARVAVPLMVLHGSADRHVPLAHVRRWAAFAAGDCRFHEIPGGHFFPYTNPESVLALLFDEVRR